MQRSSLASLPRSVGSLLSCRELWAGALLAAAMCTVQPQLSLEGFCMARLLHYKNWDNSTNEKLYVWLVEFSQFSYLSDTVCICSALTTVYWEKFAIPFKIEDICG